MPRARARALRVFLPVPFRDLGSSLPLPHCRGSDPAALLGAARKIHFASPGGVMLPRGHGCP